MSEDSEPVHLDIDPAKARELAAEVEAQWEAMKAHPVLGEFIRNFDIPSVDEDP